MCIDENKEDVYHGDDEAEVSEPDEFVFAGDAIAAAGADQVAAMGKHNIKFIFNLYFRKVGIKFDFINLHFKLEFVGSYFVQEENSFKCLLLQVGSGSGSDEKVKVPTGSGSRFIHEMIQEEQREEVEGEPHHHQHHGHHGDEDAEDKYTTFPGDPDKGADDDGRGFGGRVYYDGGADDGGADDGGADDGGADDGGADDGGADGGGADDGGAGSW